MAKLLGQRSSMACEVRQVNTNTGCSSNSGLGPLFVLEITGYILRFNFFLLYNHLL